MIYNVAIAGVVVLALSLVFGVAADLVWTAGALTLVVQIAADRVVYALGGTYDHPHR